MLSVIGSKAHERVLVNLSYRTLLPLDISAIDPDVTILYLNGNKLNVIPSNLFARIDTDRLTELYLDHNRLTDLTPEIGRLKLLRILNLADNQLEVLPPEIGQLSKLRKLNLDNNQIKDLPPEIGQLTDLTILYLSNNCLTSLPSEIEKLSNLTTIDLTENPLRFVPDSVDFFPGFQKFPQWIQEVYVWF